MIINCKMSRYRSVAILDVCTKEVLLVRKVVLYLFKCYISIVLIDGHFENRRK